MVKHTCPLCLKEFSRKSDFVYHTVDKKKPCIQKTEEIIQITPTNSEITPKNSEITPETENNLEHVEKVETQENITKPVENLSSVEKINDQEDMSKNTCAYCGLSFTRKDNLTKHLKNVCKVKRLEEERKTKIFELLIEKEKTIEEKDKQLETQSKQIDELKDMIADLNKKIDKCLDKAKTTNINKGIINNIIIPQYRLTDFGSEDLKRICPKKILKVIKESGVNGLIGCLNDIHHNDDIPEYQNVFITDKSRDKAMIWQNNDWRVKTINKVVLDIMNHIEKYIRLSEQRIKKGEYMDKKKSKDSEKQPDPKEVLNDFNNRLKKYINRYYGDDDTVNKKVSKEFEEMGNKSIINELFNIRNDVYKNYEFIKNELEFDPEAIEMAEQNEYLLKELDNLEKLLEDKKK